MNDMPGHIEYLSSSSDVGFSEEWYEVNDPEHFWFQWRWRVFSRLMRDMKLPLEANWSMLDIGCGTGLMRDRIEPETAWNVDVSELNPHALKRVQPGRGRTFFYDVLDAHDSLVNTYDAISFFDVLEHIPDPAELIEAGRSHLKPGGWLFVNVPALPSAHSRYDQVVGHLRRYTKESLSREVEACGFTVMSARYWGLLLLPPLFVRKWLLDGSKATPEQIVSTGMRPPGRISQVFLRSLMSIETSLFHAPPVGASLVLAARRYDGVPGDTEERSSL